jgi:hypothetical protein
VAGFVFLNYGAIDQIELDDPSDLPLIDELDKARWAATSAPIDQLFCDPAFLAYVDTDHNGRIRVDEVKAARRWVWERLSDRSRLVLETDELHFSSLDPAHADTPATRALAERLLVQLDAPMRDRITLSQVRLFRASYSARFPNGDGVIAPKQIPDPPLAEFVAKIVTSTGGAPDLSGEAGVRRVDLDTWLEQARAFLAWEARRASPDVIPLGSDTDDACTLVSTLSPKITQYFAQCALVALEVNAAARLQATPEELAKLDVADAGAIDAWLAQAPLARPSAAGTLSLDGPLNPRFAPLLQRAAGDVLPRLLKLDAPIPALTPALWAAAEAALAPYRAWKAERPAGIPADAGASDIEALLNGPLPERLRQLCAEDERVGEELLQFNNLERLVLYQRWLMVLANNFVSFPALFNPKQRALFEMGTLILDGRRLSLCVRVTDRAAHRKIAETSLLYLAYAEITRREGDTEVKDQIAAALTAGFVGGISVGKRGVFYDREDREWDAVIVEVISNPVSIWEAIVAPFERIRQTIVDKLTAALGTQAQALEGKAAQGAQTSVAPAGAPPPPKPPDPAANNLQGLLVGGSVAFAAIGSSAAYIFQTIASLGLTQTIVGIASVTGGMALLFGILGWLRLRQRDIAALLEACGWALNGRMRLTHYLSVLFTRRPSLPPGARRKRQLPTNTRPAFVVLLVVVVLGALAWLAQDPARVPAWLGATPAPTVPEPAPAAPAP